MTLKDESPRSVGVQYATGAERSNSSTQDEEAGPKWKWRSAVDVYGGESKVQSYKEQYSTGTWNVKSMNPGKLDMVKQEMLSPQWHLSELKWTGGQI